MIKILTRMSALALVTTMSACSQSEAPAENSAAMNDMGAMATDANNPVANS